MSANIFEKAVALGLIGSSVLFIGGMYFKGPKVDKHDAFKVRQQLLKREDTRMLYSTMSFFYLQGFQQESLDSFYTLHQIMEIEKPNIVALPISKQQYSEKYLKMMQHPKYREAMDKLIFDLKNKNDEGIKENKDFNLKNLEKLYLIERCRKIKNCEVVCGRRTPEQYKNMIEVYKNMEQNLKVESLNIDEMKIEDYTENVLKLMKPNLKISLFPEAPYKTIVGIIEPNLLRRTAQKWKTKFQKNYSHVVIEDQEVIEREKVMREAQKKPI